MKVHFHPRLLPALVLFSAPFALLNGCGGGGGGPSAPAPTPTPTRTAAPTATASPTTNPTATATATVAPTTNPTATATATATSPPTPNPTATPIPTPAPAFVGTYIGTYNFPATGTSGTLSGPFIVRVQSDGTATGTLNEDNDAQIIITSGTLDPATGTISLSANFDADSLTHVPLPTTLSASGTVNGSGASGDMTVSNSDGTRYGTFSTVKTSPSPTAVPTPEPSSASSPLVRKASATEHRLLPHHRGK